MHVSTKGRVHAAQAAAMVDAAAPMRRATSDMGEDAIEPLDEGLVGPELVPALEGELVGAAELNNLGTEPSLAPEGELVTEAAPVSEGEAVGATEYNSE